MARRASDAVHSPAALQFKEEVKRACRPSLKEPDIAANLAIVDRVMIDTDMLERAVRTLQKLIVVKDHQTALNALRLLDGIAKNVVAFHARMGSKEFVKALKQCIEKGQKGKRKSLQGGRLAAVADEAASERAAKALVLVQSWQQTLKLPYMIQLYNELVSKGTQFPKALDGEELRVLPEQAPRKEPPQWTDSKAATALDCAKLLRDTCTESDPALDLRRNELVQTMMGNAGRLHADLMRLTADPRVQQDERKFAAVLHANDELTQAIAYHDALVAGTAKRTHVNKEQKPDEALAAKKDILGLGSIGEDERKEEPPAVVVDAAPKFSATQMAAMTEEQQLAAAMQASALHADKQQQKIEEETKKKAEMDDLMELMRSPSVKDVTAEQQQQQQQQPAFDPFASLNAATAAVGGENAAGAMGEIGNGGGVAGTVADDPFATGVGIDDPFATGVGSDDPFAVNPFGDPVQQPGETGEGELFRQESCADDFAALARSRVKQV